MVERALPHTRQTRARPYGFPVEGEVAWLIVSTSWAVKGGQFQAVLFFRATAQFPWSLRPVFGVYGPARGRGYRAVVFFSASWPASRNASRQVVRRAAGIPSSRDTRSSGSPRNSRRTTSVFCRAENRWGFCHP